ncbi:MAG: Crp/Fnr family transcriptional regulator, partial [Bacteroidia bacterium]|nr:Crp/Fnr family transcriptional regulator [Bacteroidia bacterium]
MLKEVKHHYGYLFENELLDEICEIGVLKTIPEGEVLVDIGDYIKTMPLLLSGAVKVMREDDNGSDLILYFIEQGDTCAMTITCCMGQKKSEIRAISETETQLLMIPVKKMAEWMHKYTSWQNFILQSYNERMKELLEAIDTLAFLKMDERILKYLRDKAMVNHDDVIHAT